MNQLPISTSVPRVPASDARWSVSTPMPIPARAVDAPVSASQRTGSSGRSWPAVTRGLKPRRRDTMHASGTTRIQTSAPTIAGFILIQFASQAAWKFPLLASAVTGTARTDDEAGGVSTHLGRQNGGVLQGWPWRQQ